MPVMDTLELVFITPLMTLYRWLFDLLVEGLGSRPWSIVAFAVVLNLILLPLYVQMERGGRQAAARRAAMDKEIARIKAHFKGRERYYYVTTIHRHFGFKPISVVFGSFDLYLQVLVFVTVYHFLSDVKFGGWRLMGISHLNRPDGLLWGANLLPFVMTAANIVSAVLYSADAKRRRNAILLALLFLVLLYDSPAALLVYWTTNNLISLVRNVFARLFTGSGAGFGAGFGARLTEAMGKP